MTNETIKILVMVLLLGGLRTAIFVTEMPKAQLWSACQGFVEWLMASVWPVVPQLHPAIIRRHRSRRHSAD